MTFATTACSDRAELSAWVLDARSRTLALVSDLSDEQWMGPRLSIVNPIRWELGHLAWFAEHWVLRHAAGSAPLRGDADTLFDSSTVPHDVRWDLPLPDRAETLRYLEDVRDRVLARIDEASFSTRDAYFVRLAVFHEDMHDEAFAYTRQTLGYPSPIGIGRRMKVPSADRTDLGDARVPGGVFRIGAERPTPGALEPFVFDNEKWSHDVEVAPFSIARTAVSQGQFAAFVEDGGYRRAELWTDDGRVWRTRADADGPAYWRRDGHRWLRRDFDRWVPLEPGRAVVHVNAHEADAYCRWAGRRLPTEAEWEAAASGEPVSRGDRLAPHRRRFPWGDSPPSEAHACLDGHGDGCADVHAHPAGDSAFGCRQMWGNVWQWTSTPFAPYPGFVADPYKEYSEPWFHTHRVLRGGCHWTRTRLLRNTWRNFYTPDRRDVWAGFRTCALG